VNLAAPAFEIDDQGKAVHVPGTAVTDEQLEEAADNCPTAAITVVADTESDDA
jgi:ferredoxin